MREAIRMQAYSEDETDFVFSIDDKRSMSELGWEGNDEFRFNGEMYDLIEKKTENARPNDSVGQGKLIIRAIADKRETALLNKAKDHWNENEKSNKVADELFQLLQSLFHSSKTEELVFNKPSVNRIPFISTPLPSQVKKIPTPPPRV